MPTISDDFLKRKVRKIVMEVHDFHEDNDLASRKIRSLGLINRLKECEFDIDYEQKILNGETVMISCNYLLLFLISFLIIFTLAMINIYLNKRSKIIK